VPLYPANRRPSHFSLEILRRGPSLPSGGDTVRTRSPPVHGGMVTSLGYAQPEGLEMTTDAPNRHLRSAPSGRAPRFPSSKFWAPPATSHLVSRSRLRDQLDRGAPHRLTLIVGPAGAGKTVLLADGSRAGPSVRRGGSAAMRLMATLSGSSPPLSKHCAGPAVTPASGRTLVSYSTWTGPSRSTWLPPSRTTSRRPRGRACS
jgi:hypothetical protein